MDEASELIALAADRAAWARPELRMEIARVRELAEKRLETESSELVIAETEQELERLLVEGACPHVPSLYRGSVHSPEASLSAALEQILLLENHACSAHRHCRRCHRKHAVTVKALLDEAVSLSEGAAKFCALAEHGALLAESAETDDPYQVGAKARRLRMEMT